MPEQKTNTDKKGAEFILDRDAPILRQTALPVALEDIDSPRIKKVIERMKLALHSQDDGVAIAAPQIGENLRIFVVNGKALLGIATNRTVEEVTEDVPDIVFINPKITKLSKKKKEDGGRMSFGSLALW